MENSIIRKALKLKGRNIKWLAKQMRCDYPNLCIKIKSNNLSVQERNSILLLLDLKVLEILTDLNGVPIQ